MVNYGALYYKFNRCIFTSWKGLKYIFSELNMGMRL